MYFIANNSIAINSKDNSAYSFNNGKWIKTNTKLNPSNNIITTNGSYNIPTSDVTGTGNVDVNVESGGSTTSMFSTVNSQVVRMSYDLSVPTVTGAYAQNLYIMYGDNGVYDMASIPYTSGAVYVLLVNPLVRFSRKNTYTEHITYIFTPDDNYDVDTFPASIWEGVANIEPGDGKVYGADAYLGYEIYTIRKMNETFKCIIN